MGTAIAAQTFLTASTPNLAQALLDAVQSFPSNYTYSQQDFINILTKFANDNREIFLQLSTTQPDFESIKQQLIVDLSTRDAWKDIITASGGGTVIDFVASIGAYGQAGIIAALQETNLDTASLASSITLLMRMLGVHILRKVPAKVDVTIDSIFATKYGSTYGNTLLIPSFTQFTLGNVQFFNPETIIFEPSVSSIQTTLKQGVVSAYPIISTGLPFQRFEMGNGDFAISDTDVYSYQPDGTEYKRVTDGLYKYNADDLVWYENTTPEGNVEILFGNDLYGAIPPVNNILTFVYVTTSGATANSTIVGATGGITSFSSYVPDRISFSNSTDYANYGAAVIDSVDVTAISGIYGGQDEKDNEFYRAVGPYLGSGRKGMIRKPEHYAKALEFPGIVDVLIRNQKDVDPYNRNYINCVFVTPLMSNNLPMDGKTWLDFVDYMSENQIWRVDWVLAQPTMIPLPIDVSVYGTQDSNLSAIKTYATSAIIQAYGLHRGSLGSSFYLSDLTSYLNLNFQNVKVDYVEYPDTMKNVLIKPTDYLYVDKSTINLFVDTSKRNYPTFSSSTPQIYLPTS